MNTTLKLSVAASLVALLAMTRGASAGIIFDEMQVVPDKGTLELIVNQLDSDTYEATLIWSPTGYIGGATDYISNTAIKVASGTTNESLPTDPNGTWVLEPDASTNFGAGDGCGGNDQGSICAKTTDETNTTDASRTWVYQFDTNGLIDEGKFHAQVQFHDPDHGNAGQISTLFSGGGCEICPSQVPEPATLALLGLGLGGLGFSRRKQ